MIHKTKAQSKLEILESATFSVPEVAEILGYSASNIQKICTGQNDKIKLNHIEIDDFDSGKLEKYVEDKTGFVIVHEGTRPNYRIFPHTISWLMNGLVLKSKISKDELAEYIRLENEKIGIKQRLLEKIKQLHDKNRHNTFDGTLTENKK